LLIELTALMPPSMTNLNLTLTLFMLGVFADHHDPTVPPNHPALVAHFLDRGAYFHALSRLNLAMFTNMTF
jgi:hypothetical protein